MSNQFRLVHVVLVSASIATTAFPQWERQQSGVNISLQDVCFVDSLHGWAVGDNATIISTVTGGRIWEPQQSPVAGITLEKVFFVDKHTGYAIGWSGTILATKDGGRTWVKNTSGVDYLLRGLSFVNADTGWVAGSDLQSRRRGIILYTQNGGQSWHKQFETYSPNIFSSQLFSDIRFLNGREGWAFAGDYVDNFSPTNVYRTHDGGKNWAVVGQASGPLYKMSTVSSDTIWGGGFIFGISSDGGSHWKQSLWPINYVSTVRDVEQIDGKQGWLAATFITNGRKIGSRVLFTPNGGENFFEVFVDSTDSVVLDAIARFEKHLWVVGASGTILHNNERTIRVSMPRNEIPQTFQLEQNFPNPFNSGTTINFFSSKHQHVTITVYNLAGQEIAILLSKALAPGNYSVTWNGRDELQGGRFASGTYFYEIRAGDHVFKKQMMLIR